MDSWAGHLYILEMKLFFSESIILDLPDADITYFPRCYTEIEASDLYDCLLKETSWKQDTITLFGKTYNQPRLTSWYGEINKNYSYSGITMKAEPFTSTLLKIRSRVEKLSEETFNGVLLNLYRDGSDSNGWHSDDEKELGTDPVIASLSLGVNRVFKLKHKKDPKVKHDIILENGSLLLMKGTTQQFWKHQIPKSKKVTQSRINLTFRTII